MDHQVAAVDGSRGWSGAGARAVTIEKEGRALDALTGRLENLTARLASVFEVSRGLVDRHFGPRPSIGASDADKLARTAPRPSSTITTLNAQVDALNDLADRVQDECNKLAQL